MSRTYVSPGDVIPWTNDTSADVVAGQLVPYGNLIGVVIGDTADGAAGSLAVEGVHEVAKVSTAVCVAGTLLQLDVSQTPDAIEDSVATPATGDITGGALCVEAAGNGATKVKVKLLPGSGAIT